MRRILLSAAITLAVAGTAFAQTTATGVSETKIVRGASSATTTHKTTTAAAKSASHAVHKVAAVQSVVRKPAPVRQPTTPQSLRGSRYGGFAPSAPIEPPQLDTTSPRSLSMVNVNSGETISVTYWSDGSYRRDALDQLNHFLRDVKTGEQTEMDPLVLDVLWQTMQLCDYHGTVEVLSAYRSPETNAWLASVSRGVARDSQHMNGNAMDIRFPGVPVYKIRQAARSLQMGGVGFYPRSGFVHLDTGPIRYW
ncbi:Uncharacterized conserved protein YcbK, DUF882 family [Enhydrobacter aerosaccus]|uniref:Murein endopeptidase K n=1 Tax=Enhydrobacter aerosaccus TaxID=225324 RepID=A0A1T4QF72_9HYPH|nr:DUF882 domain-containing protein [Enhydrobacter aerosaccus]SKA02365.1 Uncharacterized conserved protein YcbK, DUF882 family [Enhydrobacter aerosaccus]